MEEMKRKDENLNKLKQDLRKKNEDLRKKEEQIKKLEDSDKNNNCAKEEMKIYLNSQFDIYKQTGITKEILDVIEKNYDAHFRKLFLIVKIKIENGKITIFDFTEGHVLIPYLETIFHGILEKRLGNKLPNVIFYMTLHDRPPHELFEDKEILKIPLFVFSSFKYNRHDASLFVPIPDPYLMVDSFQDNLKKIHDSSSKKPWSSKKEIAFWRGATTGGWLTADETVESVLRIPRYKLVELSKKNPHLLNARFSLYVQNENCPDMKPFVEYFGEVERIPEIDSLDSKYLISVDGNGASW